jgi:hypothetical protein
MKRFWNWFKRVILRRRESKTNLGCVTPGTPVKCEDGVVFHDTRGYCWRKSGGGVQLLCRTYNASWFGMTLKRLEEHGLIAES